MSPDLKVAADSILTRAEVASWLKVTPRQVDRLGVPACRLGRKTVRYLRADVVDWLESQRCPRRLDGAERS